MQKADKLLVAFANAANKNTLHVLDRQRFHKFLIDAYIWGRQVSDTDVRQRLEELGFSHHQATELASFYADARNLLTEYDRAKGASK